MSDLSTLPPLDVNSFDFGHMLSEFCTMRAEIADLQREVTTVKSWGSYPVRWPQLKLMTRDHHRLHVKLPALRPTPVSSTESTIEPPTSSNKTSTRVPNINMSHVLDSPNWPDKRRQRAQQTDDDGFHLVSHKNYRKKVVQSVIRTRKSSHGNNELKVYGERFLSVFISTLDPTVSIDELSLYISSRWKRNMTVTRHSRLM